MIRQPTVFVSHGSPMWALQPGRTAPALAEWAVAHHPQAILVVSPHWMTRGGAVAMTTAEPATWHDFGGFAAELYALQYPARGAPALGERAARLLAQAGMAVATDDQRPFDHGAWVPLRYMWPQADVPVAQLSLPSGFSPQALMAMGAALSPLRDEGVLIMCTGSMTHNLIERDRSADLSYVSAFASWVREQVVGEARAAMLDWSRQAPHAQRAHPSDEHFVPLFIAWGAARAGEQAQWLSDEIQFGFLAMDAVAWG